MRGGNSVVGVGAGVGVGVGVRRNRESCEGTHPSSRGMVLYTFDLTMRGK